MATYDIANIDPYVVGKVGYVHGKIHDNVSFKSGTATGSNATFVLPDAAAPLMPWNTRTATVTKADIKVYDDGVSVPISSFDPATNTVVLSSNPANGSVMKCWYVEEQELYIANNLKAPMKFDEKDLPRLRSIDKKKIFTGRTTTITLDFDLADFEGLESVAFDENANLDLRDEPVKCFGYIVLDAKTDDDKDRRIYIPESRAVFTSLIDAKAGDVAGNTLEISIDGKLRLWEET